MRHYTTHKNNVHITTAGLAHAYILCMASAQLLRVELSNEPTPSTCDVLLAHAYY